MTTRGTFGLQISNLHQTCRAHHMMIISDSKPLLGQSKASTKRQISTLEDSLFHLYMCWNVIVTWDTSGTWNM